MAVERVRDGERPSSVVASYGFNRTTIYRWLSAAARPGVGLVGLRATCTPNRNEGANKVLRRLNALGLGPRRPDSVCYCKAAGAHQ
jgi:hypothetical protein